MPFFNLINSRDEVDDSQTLNLSLEMYHSFELV
ncbi:hypothetical protein BCM19_000484 [Clostridium beijerinckii]|uniref:Uncharacterized protein n=1 Tax=Clostridium beijerinckii TaxID=1520 RepID=A0AAX0B4I8_CLOBE|nr:hypothetical protein [Clostridium beijerinckii]NRT90302.1 hypothetical protein [Clostridium beijerinckii]